MDRTERTNKTERIRNEEAVKDQETDVDTIDQGVGAEVVVVGRGH